MAQGNNFHMKLLIDGAELSALDEIEFAFKQTPDHSAKLLKGSIWKRDGSGDAITDPESENTVLVPWTRAETYRFLPGEIFYLQARFHVTGTEDEPFSPVVPLTMGPTLFGKEEEL